MTLCTQLAEYISACFTGLWVRSYEHPDALAEIVQALTRQILSGKQQRTFIVILAPVVQIPVELEKLFVVVEHEIPGRDDALGAHGPDLEEKRTCAALPRQ